MPDSSRKLAAYRTSLGPLGIFWAVVAADSLGLRFWRSFGFGEVGGGERSCKAVWIQPVTNYDRYHLDLQIQSRAVERVFPFKRKF